MKGFELTSHESSVPGGAQAEARWAASLVYSPQTFQLRDPPCV